MKLGDEVRTESYLRAREVKAYCAIMRMRNETFQRKSALSVYIHWNVYRMHGLVDESRCEDEDLTNELSETNTSPQRI